MEQSPWEANSHWASQEIPLLLWNPKVHYCDQKNSPLVPILIHIRPVYTFPPHFSEIHSNTTLPPTPVNVYFIQLNAFSERTNSSPGQNPARGLQFDSHSDNPEKRIDFTVLSRKSYYTGHLYTTERITTISCSVSTSSIERAWH
jgi:hypothetical protein